MKNDLLIKLQHFFTVDMRIKKEMYDMVPPDNESYLDKDSICKYVDNLNDSLIYIFSELKCFCSDIFANAPFVLEKINSLEQNVKESFYSCGLDISKLRNFYKENVSNLSSEFIKNLKTNCVGYTGRKLIPLDNINTINEALHFIHSYILNEEHLLQAIPLLGEKENDYKYPISLRGEKIPVFEELFNLFPMDLDCGWTDMVIINEKKLIMMVRDRGHALTIEITLNNDKARIEYFIPKVCNLEMVNNLPGINKIKDDTVGATGIIETDIKDLPNVLFSFISKVPMDEDMEYFKK